MTRHFVLLFTLTASALTAQTSGYERRELAIPMRDGVVLHAVAFLPDAPGPFPILLVRTPFGADREFRGDAPPAAYAELAKDGYIFVGEDIRGRGRSAGAFVTLRAMADPRDPAAIDESTDAYDTIGWLVANLPRNSGKVGVLGHSYRGWLAALAAVRPHPALKAVSPQAPMTDVWMGDDFFHYGAFRQTQGVLYSGYIEGDGVALPEGSDYDVYLRYPNLDSLARAAGVDSLPTWRATRGHQAYDPYWQSRALTRILTRATVPTLLVAGAWDEEDIYGAPALFRALDHGGGRARTHLVLGPWSHGTWVRSAGDSLGGLPLGSPTGTYYRSAIERPWFAFYLHGRGNGRFPRVWAYETGADRWHELDGWPRTGTRPTRLYLAPDGTLSFTPPTATGQACDGYDADPAHPVPNAPAEGGPDNWLLADQRFLAGRTDLRTWRSAPLTEDLVIAGDIAARLFASTTGTDADWVVKLIDEAPDGAPSGPQLMVGAEIVRGRYWQGFDRPAPLVPGRVQQYTLDLHAQYYRFRRGHRLVVQVQSSWFPMYDRNPQTFVPDIFSAPAGAFRTARQCIWRDARHPTHLVLPVVQ